MLTFELVTQSGMKFAEQVFEVIIPTPNGQVAIFPDHMPLVTLADPGVVYIRKNQLDKDEDMEHFATNGGVVEVEDTLVRLLSDEAIHPSEVNEQAALDALNLAKKEAALAQEQVDIDKANQMVSVQQARLKIAGLRKNKRK